MAPFPGNRPQTPAMILQCIAEIDIEDSSSGIIENSRVSSPLNQTQLGRENTKITTGKTLTKHQIRTKIKDTKISRIKDTKISRHKSKIKLKNNLITISTMLLLAAATSQFYGFWRYRMFPADPILLLRGLNSSRFLQNTLNGYLGQVNAIALTPDGQNLATGGSNTIKIWNLKTGELRNNIADAHTAQVTTLAITPSGRILVSGSADRTIKLWDLGVGKLIDTIQAHQGQVNAVAISPDGQTLASVGSDRLMKFWNIQTSNRMLTWIPDQENEVNTLAFSRDGTILVSGSNDGTIRLWNVSTGIRRQTLEGHTKAVNTVAISPDNQTLASGSEDGTIRLWNLDTGKKEGVIKPNIGAVKSIVFSPDSQKIVAGGENIIIWDLITEENLQTFIGHSKQISSLSITPDGKTLVSGSLDQTIKVWRMP